MSRERAVDYINQVVQMLREGDFLPRDKALILASLAHAEATLELVDQFRAGLPLNTMPLGDQLEEFSAAANLLSRQLGDR